MENNINNERDYNDEIIKDNFIIAYINTNRKYSQLKIINCLEKDEEGIKNCDIFINDKKIDFSYFYYFQNKGI